jgi:DNA-binding response OmpR family regulator
MSESLLRGTRILVVEDDPDLLDVVTEGLQYFGAYVVKAENGKRGFELATTEAFDIILSDFRMPRYNGLTLLKNLREVKMVDPLFFFFTGGSEISEADAKELGATGLFYKPIEIESLALTLSNLWSKAA